MDSPKIEELEEAQARLEELEEAARIHAELRQAQARIQELEQILAPKTERRPRLLDDERVRDGLLESLRAGNPIDYACGAVGIDRSTFYDWMAKGRVDKEGIYREFFQAAERAKWEARERLVTIIANDAVDNPESAKWMLERLDSNTWGVRVRVAVEEELDAALDRLEAALSAAEFERIARILLGQPDTGPTGEEGGGAPPSPGEPPAGATEVGNPLPEPVGAEAEPEVRGAGTPGPAPGGPGGDSEG